MSHNTALNLGSGGDTIVDYDLAAGGAYPTSGKVPACVLYVSANATTAPVPVTAANPLPVGIAAGSALMGAVNVAPAVAGGLSLARIISAATTNATSIKAAAGQLYGYALFNTNASAFRYLKVFDKASAPVVGTDIPVLTLGLPPLGGANLEGSIGKAFVNGIAVAITGGMADSDTTAVAANEVAINLFYK